MSPLEGSSTLEDVFTVVEAKRVPLAPELAGYLALEIADGTDAGSGDVDPKTVFISEEGTVALVWPKKEVTRGDAEASVRQLLAKLLDASGSGTPALTTAAKRKPGNGLPALVEELEAALIPVNRAAGRRALARLAREVKRVTLGVGRNASVAPVGRATGEIKPVAAPPHARPPIRKRDDAPKAPEQPKAPRIQVFPPEEPETSRRQRDIPDDAIASEQPASMEPPAPAPSAAPAAAAPAPPEPAAAPPAKESAKAPPVKPAPVASRPPLPPPPTAAKGSAPAPPLPPKREGISAPPPPTLFGGDEVDSLLDTFGVSNLREDKLVARDLKAIAGLSPTPPPPDATTLAELTKDVGQPKKKRPNENEDEDEGDGVEALLALADASVPLPLMAKTDEDDATPLVKMPLKSLEPRDEDAGQAPIPAAGMPPPPPAPSAPSLPDDRPLSAKNLPANPLFGPPPAASSSPMIARAAPAALRQAADGSEPTLPRDPDDRFSSGEPRAALAAPVKSPDPPKIRAAAPAPPPPPPPRAKDPPPPPMPTKKIRPRKSAPRTGIAMLVIALLVLAGGTVAIWKFAPQVFTGRRPAPPETVAPAPVIPPPRCKVTLVLSDVPTNAEILLRVGQAGVDVERMPVGTRLEFVATAEGYAPKRAVIQAEASWDKSSDGKPRIEVPIQLEASKAKPGMVDPWPAAEPGSQVGGSGSPGTVHVVSNVRGAEVWLLAGLGPEARIDQLRCDADIDVLIAGTGQLRRRVHVPEKDIAATTTDPQGNKVVSIAAPTK